MASLTVSGPIAFELDDLVFVQLQTGEVTTTTGSRVVVSYDTGGRDVFIGSGFAYSDGVPVAGTVTRYEYRPCASEAVRVPRTAHREIVAAGALTVLDSRHA